MFTVRRMTPREIYLEQKADFIRSLKAAIPTESFSTNISIKIPNENLPAAKPIKEVPLKIVRSYLDILARVLLKLAGHEDALIDGNTNIFFADAQMGLFLNIVLPEDYFNTLIAQLNRLYPTLNVVFSGSGKTIAGAQVCAMGFSPLNLTQNILPMLKNYLVENPEILANSEYGYATLSHTFTTLFEKYGISTVDTDVVEETMHAVVRHNLKWNNYKFKQFFNYLVNVRGFPANALQYLAEFLPALAEYQQDNSKDILTSNSIFTPYLTEKNTVRFHVTTSIKAAKHIAHYFNNIIPNSASVKPERVYNEERKCEMTLIDIKNEALLSAAFQETLEYALQTYTQTQLDAYRKQSKTITESVSDSIATLQKHYDECRALTKDEPQPVGIIKLFTILDDLIPLLSNPEFKFNLKKPEPQIVESKDESDEMKDENETPAAEVPTYERLSAEAITLLNNFNHERGNVFAHSRNHGRVCDHCKPNFFQQLPPLKQHLFCLFNAVENILNIANNKYKMEGSLIGMAVT